MSKLIHIRNVPESVHRTLKTKALAEMSLSNFLLAEIRIVAERPTIAELRKRLRHRSPTVGLVSAAKAVRQERDAGHRH